MRDSAAQALPTRRRWLTRLATCAFLLLAAGEFYNCVFCCDHDFLWHRNFGIDFLSNSLYESTGQHYLPARAMIDAVTAWMPYRLDRAMWFLAMCGGLAWCTRFWSLVAKPTTKNWLLPAGIALAVMATYIHRDLAECGLQLFLLCLLTAALSALLSGRPARCGAWLGLATVYKVMPLVFLPFLIWKRQWRAAAWMTVFGCFFCLLPAAFLGWEKNRDLHDEWLRNARQRLAIEDPSENGVEPPTLWNRSLPLAMAAAGPSLPTWSSASRRQPWLCQVCGLRSAHGPAGSKCFFAESCGGAGLAFSPRGHACRLRRSPWRASGLPCASWWRYCRRCAGCTTWCWRLLPRSFSHKEPQQAGHRAGNGCLLQPRQA